MLVLTPSFVLPLVAVAKVLQHRSVRCAAIIYGEFEECQSEQEKQLGFEVGR